jgi:hypothetical protein
MLSHPPKSMRRSSRANCQTKPLQKRFIAAQERSEAFALSQRIGKAVCRGLIRIENTFTKTSPARMLFGTRAIIEKLLGVTKRSVQPEKDSGNGNETATANSLPSKSVDFESSASASSATPAQGTLKLRSPRRSLSAPDKVERLQTSRRSENFAENDCVTQPSW